MSNVMECRDLSKVYKLGWFRRQEITALRRITWTVRSGERWVIFGPNRAGKSTLLKLIVSLLRPTSGSLYRFGKSADQLATLARVGYVSESAVLPLHWTVEGLLQWSSFLHGLRGRQQLRRVAHTLEEFKLKDYSSGCVSQLSRGIRQRLALALAWCHQPELIVLDEPFDGLDNPGRQLLQELLFINASAAITYIMATHQHAFARAWATHALLLENGALSYSGPIQGCEQEFKHTIMSPTQTTAASSIQGRVPCSVS